MPEAPGGSNFRSPVFAEEERSYDEQIEILAHTGAEVLEVHLAPKCQHKLHSRTFRAELFCTLGTECSAMVDAQVGPIGTVAQGNRAVTSAARSGLPIWLAVSAALHPPPTAAAQSGGAEGGSTFVIPELCVMLQLTL